MSARGRLFVGLSLLLAVLSLCALVLFAVAEGATASASSPRRQAAQAQAAPSPRLGATSAGRAGPPREVPLAERTFAPAPTMRAANEPVEAGETPHPLDGERARIQHELQLIGALNDALDRGDAAHMRTLLALYREHDSNDVERLQEGYAVVADCLEKPGEASRRAAQAFYDEARASTLRRYVRRSCLERARE